MSEPNTDVSDAAVPAAVGVFGISTFVGLYGGENRQSQRLRT